MSDDKILTDPIILMCAFRYALGRATYIVGWVADELIAHKDALRPQWRQQTVRDIREAVGSERAGMDMDARRWLDVVAAFHAMPGACRGCALTEDVCRQFRPLCCDRCDHGPGEPLSVGEAS